MYGPPDLDYFNMAEEAPQVAAGAGAQSKTRQKYHVMTQNLSFGSFNNKNFNHLPAIDSPKS